MTTPRCPRCHRRAKHNECMESMCPQPWEPPSREPTAPRTETPRTMDSTEVAERIRRVLGFGPNEMFPLHPPASPPPVAPIARETETEDDAKNLDGLLVMCADLKRRLVPHGASAEGWDSLIATITRLRATSASSHRVVEAAREVVRVWEDGDCEWSDALHALRAAITPPSTHTPRG